MIASRQRGPVAQFDRNRLVWFHKCPVYRRKTVDICDAPIFATSEPGSRTSSARSPKSARPQSEFALERTRRSKLADMLEERLAKTPRLAINPAEGIDIDALHGLAWGDDATHWDIGTAAAYLGVSSHTLRYYERAGLLTVPRDVSGHRRYDAAAIRRLVFIIRMRASGMPIARLQHYIALVSEGQSTVNERLELLAEHRDALRHKIEELQLALAVTEYKIATYKEGPRP